MSFGIAFAHKRNRTARKQSILRSFPRRLPRRLPRGLQRPLPRSMPEIVRDGFFEASRETFREVFRAVLGEDFCKQSAEICKILPKSAENNKILHQLNRNKRSPLNFNPQNAPCLPQHHHEENIYKNRGQRWARS